MNTTRSISMSSITTAAIVIVLIAASTCHVQVHAADQTIGAVTPSGGGGFGGGFIFSYTDWVSSINGLVTTVTFQTNPATVSTLKIYTFRFVSGTGYNIVGKSDVSGTFPANSLNTDIALDTPLPVLPGDYVGFSVASGDQIGTLTAVDGTLITSSITGGGPNAGTCATLAQQTPRRHAAVSFFIDEQTVAAPFVGTTCPGGANGDPQFSGLQGQSFQVHGFADSYFNLISTPTFQMNGRFAYIANGECTQNYTECWTHPGTYIDHIGFQLQAIDRPLLRIELMAGARTMKVIIDGEVVEMNGANRKYRYNAPTDVNVNTTEMSTLFAITSIEYEWVNFYTFHLQTNLWDITIYNSHDFFNLQVAMLNRSLMKAGSLYYDVAKSHIHHHQTDNKFYPTLPIHGFIGNTWKNMKYENGKLYQGSVSDYETSGVFGVDFLYNHFIKAKNHA